MSDFKGSLYWRHSSPVSSGPLVSEADGSRIPVECQTHRCSSPMYEMAPCLHTARHSRLFTSTHLSITCNTEYGEESCYTALFRKYRQEEKARACLVRMRLFCLGIFSIIDGQNPKHKTQGCRGPTAQETPRGSPVLNYLQQSRATQGNKRHKKITQVRINK